MSSTSLLSFNSQLRSFTFFPRICESSSNKENRPSNRRSRVRLLVGVLPNISEPPSNKHNRQSNRNSHFFPNLPKTISQINISARIIGEPQTVQPRCLRRTISRWIFMEFDNKCVLFERFSIFPCKNYEDKLVSN